jgi:hypothetical protein
LILSASSHLHPPPQVPEHADRIEWIDGSRTRKLNTAVVVLKVERPRHAQLDLFDLPSLGASLRRHMGLAALFVIVPGHDVLRLARLERRRSAKTEFVRSKDLAKNREVKEKGGMGWDGVTYG